MIIARRRGNVLQDVGEGQFFSRSEFLSLVCLFVYVEVHCFAKTLTNDRPTDYLE